MAHSEPYIDRRTWLMQSIFVNDWKFKLYGMSGDGRDIEAETVSAAIGYIRGHVPLPTRPGYGFVILHRGQEAMWLLVDWWQEDILHHQLYAAPLQNQNAFEPAADSTAMACVWEMLVMQHERSAWVKHVMKDPECPDYLAWESDVLAIDHPSRS